MYKLEFKYHTREVVTLKFKDVKENQLYLSLRGNLCQKIDPQSSHQIATNGGELYASGPYTVDGNEEVLHIYTDIWGIKL